MAVALPVLLGTSLVLTDGVQAGLSGTGALLGSLIAERFARRWDNPSRWVAGPPEERWR